MGKIIDLTGKIYGRLTVLKFHEFRNNIPFWECQCSCGKTNVSSGKDMLAGKIKSCGCLRWHTLRERKARYKHKREYRIWSAMKTRCTNPNQKSYEQYGALGITICDRWLAFDNFIEDMGPIPDDKNSIDRIENDKGYYKENCRWADHIEQANNRKSVHNVTMNGKTQSVAKWARELGVHQGTFYSRINQLGWTPEQAVFTPVISGQPQRHPKNIS